MSDYCLTPTKKLVSHIMSRTSYLLMR